MFQFSFTPMRVIGATFLIIFGVLTMLGNKNGRAASQNKGNTGAPGDELNANGTPKTCVNCHNTGISTGIEISVRDSMGLPVTSYIPGKDYIARVRMTAAAPSAQGGYGFQMIALRDANNTDLDGFSDWGSFQDNNYKISNINNGRTYAEQDNVSDSSFFDVRWKAPSAGTGNITFYASGNVVNGNGGTGGDGAATSSLHLTESVVSSVPHIVATDQLKAWPNPVQSNQNVQIRMFFPISGEYRFEVSDLTGKSVEIQNHSMLQGEHTLSLPTTSWPAGVLWVRCILNDQTILANVKVVKLKQ